MMLKRVKKFDIPSLRPLMPSHTKASSKSLSSSSNSSSQKKTPLMHKSVRPEFERERKNSKKTGNSSLWSCHYIDYNTHSQFFLTYCGPKRECKKSIQEAISGPPFSITRPIHARKLFSKNENTARAFRQDRELFELQDFAISFRD